MLRPACLWLLCLDGIEAALLPYLRAEFEKNPWNGQHRNRQKAEQTRSPWNTQPVVHCQGTVSTEFDSQLIARCTVARVEPLTLHSKQRERSPNNISHESICCQGGSTVQRAIHFAKYKAAAVKTDKLPHAKGTVASMGLIQWMSALAVQANQNRPMGKPILPIMAT